MAVLLYITLLSILGILQGTSAGYETKDMEVKNIEYEVKCSLPNLKSLIEDYPKYSSILKDAGEFKDNTIKGLNSIIEARQKCECGKESDDKKCVEEFVSAFRGLIDTLYLFRSVYFNIIIDALHSISEKASLALNELSCCCKVEVCQKKLEYPEAKYKGSVKECKPEKCNSLLSKFISNCTDYVAQETTSRLLQDQCVEEYEKLVKSKEEIPSEGKCKEETAAFLFQKTRSVQLCFEKLAGNQLVGYENFAIRVLSSATKTMKEFIRCSKESLKGKKD